MTLESMFGNVANAATGGVLGLALNDAQNQQQLGQQAALNDLNFQLYKRTSDYNLQNQLSLWNQTNYPAQVQQLEKAGLNPALLYAKGGVGGSTAANPGVSGGSQATGSNSGNAIAMASNMMNLQLIKAQAENINADTELKKQQAADAAGSAANRPLQGQNIQTQTASLAQGIQNQQAAEALTKVQTKIQQIEFDYAGASFQDRLDLLSQQARQMTGMATQALVQGGVDESTKLTKIESIKQNLVQQFLQQELTSANTSLINNQSSLTIEQKNNIAQQMTLEYMKLSNMKDQTAINAELANFKTDPMTNAAEVLGHILKVVPFIGK